MTDAASAARSAAVSEDEQEYQAPGETRAVVAPADAGERVDAWLAKLWPDLSRSRVQGLIGAGKLSVDGVPVTHAKDKPRAGARYEITLPPPEPASPLPEPLPTPVPLPVPEPAPFPAPPPAVMAPARAASPMKT